MPREMISPARPGAEFAAKLGWSAHSPDVQVGVEIPDDNKLAHQLYGDYVGKIGDAVRDLAATDARPDSHLSDAQVGTAVLDILEDAYRCRGLWASLDRAGCNQLVRLARRARDTTFGKDE